jgi:hypothetical protein
MRITEDQRDLLSQIVDGYAEVKEEFYFSTGMGIGTTMQQARVKGRESVDHGDIEELRSFGLIDLTPGTSPMSGRFRPTAEGIHFINEQRRLDAIAKADQATGSGGLGVSWEATLPVLQAVVDLYNEASAGQDVSQVHVNQRLGREEKDPDTSRAFEVLERAGYLEGKAGVWQLPGSLLVAPTEKTLQLLAGWPASGAVVYERLIGGLKAQIDATADEEEKGRLKRALDAMQGIGEGVAVEVLTKVMMGG